MEKKGLKIMTQKEKEYLEKYGEIPNDKEGRLNYILSHVKSKHALDSLKPEINRIKNIKWKTVTYTIYVIPKASPRPRRSANGHFYVSGAADNKRFFKNFYKQTLDTPIIDTPCIFYCDAYLPIPSDMRLVDQVLAEMGLIRPLKKPDFDNLAKTYSDMVQGVLLYDDALIIEGISRKWYSCKPRIEIKFKYMTSYDSDYNKKRILKAEEIAQNKRERN
jgi:Holliday junction resolvase RusA-like endonuclease